MFGFDMYSDLAKTIELLQEELVNPFASMRN